ncbi:metal-dependent transcriptional regulator [Salinivirga cyanobacteriivorans]|uniref:Manganese transport transcriptional regulator n=1 Tax=Salinivirga cyanobacteriivorans TaxID=1307839 RepID=A0A0S2I3E1_9BACT|nr:metal-dependent transcriptional regulator [Salinivirga cyanobacteriivorans]ALO16870.1 manganese transport transcriptional regulator [Salinivirga cyanobacteriivorans]
MLSHNARIFLTTLYEHTRRGDRLRTTFLAEKLKISKAAITEISRTLRDEGFIVYEPYKPYELTISGEKVAQKLFYRVAIIEKFYFTQFKILPYRAKSEAINSEPALSEFIIEQMKNLTPAPEISLFGHPIVDPLPFKTLLLSNCETDMIVQPIAIKPVAENYQSNLWVELASLIGKKIRINEVDKAIEAIQIIVNNESRHISLKLADKIIVTAD